MKQTTLAPQKPQACPSSASNLAELNNRVILRRTSHLPDLLVFPSYSKREHKSFNSFSRVKHSQPSPHTEGAALVAPREDILTSNSRFNSLCIALMDIRRQGVRVDHQQANGHHFNTAKHAWDAHMQVRPGQGIGRLQLVGAVQDPEDDLLDEGERDDKLKGHQFRHGLVFLEVRPQGHGHVYHAEHRKCDRVVADDVEL